MNVLDGSFDDKNIQAGANVNELQLLLMQLAWQLKILVNYVIRGAAS